MDSITSSEINSGDAVSDGPESSPGSPRLGIKKKPIVLPKASNDILLRLENITVRMRFIGLLVFMTTGANLLLVFINLFEFNLNSYAIRLIAGWMMAFAGASFILVIFHEYLRKIGDTLFEEISEDLQNRVRNLERVQVSRKRNRVGTKVSKKEVPINAKTILRSFAKAADLPLIPGKFGPGIYAVINIALLFLHFFILSYRSSIKF